MKNKNILPSVILILIIFFFNIAILNEEEVYALENNEMRTYTKYITKTKQYTCYLNCKNYYSKSPLKLKKEESKKIPVTKKQIVKNNTKPHDIVNSDISNILVNYNINEEQFFTIVAIVAAEGGGTYTDAYAVANVIYNRSLTPRWINYANSLGYNGNNIYSQAILKNQFTVYQSGSYKKYMYQTGTNAYNATVTLLTTKELMHNYLSFRSGRSNTSGTQFVEGGNIYY